MALYAEREDARTIAWIFYSVALATQREPANFNAISRIADGINHAVPTHQEMQKSLKWLCMNELVAKGATGYTLTEKGSVKIALARTAATTASDVMKLLTSEFHCRIGAV